MLAATQTCTTSATSSGAKAPPPIVLSFEPKLARRCSSAATSDCWPAKKSRAAGADGPFGVFGGCREARRLLRRLALRPPRVGEVRRWRSSVARVAASLRKVAELGRRPALVVHRDTAARGTS